MNLLLPLGKPTERLDQFGVVGLLAFDQFRVAGGAGVDAHLQGADHAQFGQRVDQRRLLRLAGPGAAGRRLVVAVFLGLFQGLDHLLQSGQHVFLDPLRDFVHLGLGQPIDDLPHVVAHLVDGFGKRHRAAFFAQQEGGLVHFDDDLRLLAA